MTQFESIRYPYPSHHFMPIQKITHHFQLDEVNRFKPKITGRPRKNTPMWRTSPENNQLLTTSILVSVKPDQYKKLQRLLGEIKQLDEHIFPGTIARYIINSKSHPESIEIILIWRNTTMPEETVREQALDEFRRKLASVLDWNSGQPTERNRLAHQEYINFTTPNIMYSPDSVVRVVLIYGEGLQADATEELTDRFNKLKLFIIDVLKEFFDITPLHPSRIGVVI